nr:MAG TPA: hypothetical protein [Caudoviricetes sp.]
MTNLTVLKKQVKQKLEQARLHKQQNKRKDNNTCNHTWQRFKQTVQPEERTHDQIKLGMEYKGQRAYFIVMACTTCHIKRFVEFKVER